MSSTAEAAAAARVVSGDAAQSATALFDTHLRLLNESYLAFFIERKRIEEQYIASLMKLHLKSKSLDAFMDDRVEHSTTRAAWIEIVDNVEREAGAHRALADSVYVDVIEPLNNFKEEQERIRKRIREDVKDAITAHSDYAENTLPRLKRNYIKKCQEAEEYRSAAVVSPTSPQDPNVLPPLSKAPPPQNPNGIRPVVTGPQPLRPLERRASQNVHRNRSPSASTSTALHDLAHQGKRQLNQLMTFLDKGGNVRDGGRSDNALRLVRAKREAEEADKEYRKGVHWLETLRIRRVKILESGFKSLESFVRESSETMRKVLEVYTDSLTAAAAIQGQLCEHGRQMVEQIVPQQDSAAIAASIRGMLSLLTPKPTYYYNFNVGECKDLIFGVTLVDYATARGLPEGDIPKIVRICIEDIDRRGLEAEGIYRVSGRHAAVQELQHKIERNEAAFAFNPTTDDVYSVASFLKMYLRELPEPVFKFPLQDRIQHTEGIDEHAANNFSLLRSKIRRLPAIHQATLRALVEHLARVAANSDKNKMDPKNLAIVFGSVIFGEDEMPKGGDILGMQSWKDTLMEDLIVNAHILFQQSGSSSPPLPSAPLNEPAAPVAYGSQHTKVLSSMPPPPVPASPRKGHKKSASTSTVRSSLDVPRPHVPQDFTPQLPPRPANSIHPSLRAGPHAGSPARQIPSARAGQFFDDDMLITPQTSISSREHGSSTSLPPQLPPRPEELSPFFGPTGSSWTLAASAETDASTNVDPVREPSSKRSSRQIPSGEAPRPTPSPIPVPQVQLSDDPPADVFSPPPPSSLRSASHESGIEMSSTAAAAAFASATPSPTSSSHSSAHSSPSKRSAGHSRKGSA
ncbi:RhoGAP-domain-containing protein [Dichomitus squalens]|uniref:RhoGAP-domain-containing protein n=1 Tax=Dichomitus squalens (strain LYAD-421) TaxID=732165 RepID=UPI0004411927|nr:RhoGAP-domain-containing protein [Dichomitus squalens LYAD-421 SS1]EJF66392.1 RhoGAP-domain-containing protein [Dichomitus squalens LYAD-421 SS1]TBU47336.1 RhoGAP-domain-containing protein [Dichomitus squalens]